MDFNRLYFDHQLSLIKAREAMTGESRRRHEAEATRIAGCIGQKQTKLGAAAACAWVAGGWEQPT